MRSSLLRPSTKGKPDSCSHGVRSPAARSAIYQEIQSKRQRHGEECHHEFHPLLGAFFVLGKKVFISIVGQDKSPSFRVLSNHIIAPGLNQAIASWCATGQAARRAILLGPHIHAYQRGKPAGIGAAV